MTIYTNVLIGILIVGVLLIMFMQWKLNNPRWLNGVLNGMALVLFCLVVWSVTHLISILNTTIVGDD